jgi:hypothetical protein
MVWVSKRMQSIPLADTLCLKEVRDILVGSRKERVPQLHSLVTISDGTNIISRARGLLTGITG